jgi:hypothetical protein
MLNRLMCGAMVVENKKKMALKIFPSDCHNKPQLIYFMTFYVVHFMQSLSNGCVSPFHVRGRACVYMRAGVRGRACQYKSATNIPYRLIISLPLLIYCSYFYENSNWLHYWSHVFAIFRSVPIIYSLRDVPPSVRIHPSRGSRWTDFHDFLDGELL